MGRRERTLQWRIARSLFIAVIVASCGRRQEREPGVVAGTELARAFDALVSTPPRAEPSSGSRQTSPETPAAQASNGDERRADTQASREVTPRDIAGATLVTDELSERGFTALGPFDCGPASGTGYVICRADVGDQRARDGHDNLDILFFDDDLGREKLVADLAERSGRYESQNTTMTLRNPELGTHELVTTCLRASQAQAPITRCVTRLSARVAVVSSTAPGEGDDLPGPPKFHRALSLVGQGVVWAVDTAHLRPE